MAGTGLESDEVAGARGQAEGELERLDYYTLLQVDRRADVHTIKAAFHRFALKFHPDRHCGAESAKSARAHAIYRRGAEGYRVLTDPQRRARYDDGLGHGVLRLVELERELPKAKAGEVVIKSLAARPFYQHALAALKKGDLKNAKLNLSIACMHERDNAELDAMMRDVQEKLRALETKSP